MNAIAQRAAQRHAARASERAAWNELDDDVWDSEINRIASDALLIALHWRHPEGGAR